MSRITSETDSPYNRKLSGFQHLLPFKNERIDHLHLSKVHTPKTLFKTIHFKKAVFVKLCSYRILSFFCTCQRGKEYFNLFFLTR